MDGTEPLPKRLAAMGVSKAVAAVKSAGAVGGEDSDGGGETRARVETQGQKAGKKQSAAGAGREDKAQTSFYNALPGYEKDSLLRLTRDGYVNPSRVATLRSDITEEEAKEAQRQGAEGASAGADAPPAPAPEAAGAAAGVGTSAKKLGKR
jgi:hypothetical protein